MASAHHSYDTLNSLFFNNLINIYPSSNHAYHCTSISDLDFAKLGILRCVSSAKTGHEFLQDHAEKGEAMIGVEKFQILQPQTAARRAMDSFRGALK
jgi:hypothetical protein